MDPGTLQDRDANHPVDYSHLTAWYHLDIITSWWTKTISLQRNLAREPRADIYSHTKLSAIRDRDAQIEIIRLQGQLVEALKAKTQLQAQLHVAKQMYLKTAE